MDLSKNGLDVFYIDESHDANVYVVTAVAIPFLRALDGHWRIVWPDHLEAAKAWRKEIWASHKIPRSKELHGVKLASGRGNFKQGKHNFDKAKASAVYRATLRGLNWIPNASIISCAVTKGHLLYGADRLEAAMHALFQRMTRQCSARNTSAITFFDEGHGEYRKLYRKAQVYLPTGSKVGGWQTGSSINIHMSMFTKDANENNSKHCYFTQIADIVAWSAFVKVKSEIGELTDWQKQYKLETLYDEIPREAINLRASYSKPKDGIVRLHK